MGNNFKKPIVFFSSLEGNSRRETKRQRKSSKNIGGYVVESENASTFLPDIVDSENPLVLKTEFGSVEFFFQDLRFEFQKRGVSSLNYSGSGLQLVFDTAESELFFNGKISKKHLHEGLILGLSGSKLSMEKTAEKYVISAGGKKLFCIRDLSATVPDFRRNHHI